MGEMTRQQIIKQLVKNGAPRDQATLYADWFLEYREACQNIEKNGIIVSHPRTANPIKNPYLEIRDNAAKKMAAMRRLKADFLW
jgi:phage terminase small subunit